jgi:hypothetical protein
MLDLHSLGQSGHFPERIRLLPFEPRYAGASDPRDLANERDPTSEMPACNFSRFFIVRLVRLPIRLVSASLPKMVKRTPQFMWMEQLFQGGSAQEVRHFLMGVDISIRAPLCGQ